ncbi:hypothetical protein CR513_61248, partial [Mucuna pruriens]
MSLGDYAFKSINQGIGRAMSKNFESLLWWNSEALGHTRAYLEGVRENLRTTRTNVVSKV